VKGKDAARARLGIAVIAEDDFGIGGDIFEATLSRINAKPFRCFSNIAVCLIGVSGERSPGGLCFDYAQNCLSTKSP
jgi:hypothetical protein